MFETFKNYSKVEKSIVIFLLTSIIVLGSFGVKVTIDKFDTTPIQYTGGF